MSDKEAFELCLALGVNPTEAVGKTNRARAVAECLNKASSPPTPTTPTPDPAIP